MVCDISIGGILLALGFSSQKVKAFGFPGSPGRGKLGDGFSSSDQSFAVDLRDRRACRGTTGTTGGCSAGVCRRDARDGVDGG